MQRRESIAQVWKYFLLASAHFSGHEVEAYSPEIFARRRLVVDGRDEEIIEFFVKSSKGICFVKPFLLLSRQRTPPFSKESLTRRNRIWRICWRRPVQWCKSAPHMGSYHCWFR